MPLSSLRHTYYRLLCFLFFESSKASPGSKDRDEKKNTRKTMRSISTLALPGIKRPSCPGTTAATPPRAGKNFQRRKNVSVLNVLLPLWRGFGFKWSLRLELCVTPLFGPRFSSYVLNTAQIESAHLSARHQQVVAENTERRQHVRGGN